MFRCDCENEHSSFRGHSFVSSFEEVRPDPVSEVMRREIPKTVRPLENDIVEISHVLWEKILDLIDEYDRRIFGV